MSASESPRIPRQARFPADIPARVHHHGVDYACVARNLSRSGVLLEGGIPRTTDESLEFSLSTSAGSLEVRLRGRVARVSEGEGDVQTTFVLEFLDLAPESRQALDDLLARVIERPPHPGSGVESIHPGMSPAEIRKILQGIPLPERIALAIRAKPLEREFLQHDIHPAVLESLLRSPGISVGEVAALLPSPALSPAMLEKLSRDPRWERDIELKIALATHPRIPTPIAERIVDQLPADALRKVMKQPTVVPALRSKIIRRLASG